MPGYSLRGLKELSQEARGFFVQAIDGAIVSIWANTFTVIAKVLALLNYEHELRRRWLFTQIFASTAEEVWLTRHAYELGLIRSPGTPAHGAVTLDATPGLAVPAGLILVRSDGLTYTSVASAIAGADGVTLEVEADLVGAGGNLDLGETLTVSPDNGLIAGLGDVATVDADGLSAGTDKEELEAFRARVLARKRRPPHGGAAHDYDEWARQALPTVRDVFVDSFANDTRAIWVQFTVTDQPDGIPTADQVETVQSYLSDPVRRPVTARVFVTASDPVPVPVVIKGLKPDTPDIRASIEAELVATFIDRAEPGKPEAGPFAFDASWIGEAVSRATGEDRHRILIPIADPVLSAGQMPILGSIDYVP